MALDIFRCPMCEGRGRFDRHDTATVYRETCRICEGSGLVRLMDCLAPRTQWLEPFPNRPPSAL